MDDKQKIGIIVRMLAFGLFAVLLFKANSKPTETEESISSFEADMLIPNDDEELPELFVFTNQL